MSEPLCLCLEELDGERTWRCVALVGSQPGLRLDAAGLPCWCPDGAAVELWVSGDDRPVLRRAGDAPGATVRRGGRALEVPEGKPVLLLGGDELEVGGRRLRLHLHGAASEVRPPELLALAPARAAEPPRGGARGRVAAMALGAVIGAAPLVAAAEDGPGEPPPIELRDRPPDVSPPHPPPKPKKEKKEKKDEKKKPDKKKDEKKKGQNEQG